MENTVVAMSLTMILGAFTAAHAQQPLPKAAAFVSAEADRASDDSRTTLSRDEGARRYIKSAEAWAKNDIIAARRSLAAAAGHVEEALSSAGQKTESVSITGLRTAESFGEKVANRTTTATEQAWTTATGAARQGIEKLGKVVDGRAQAGPSKH